MGTLYLVRHGQASFGADNYDQLSPLGHRQCVRLGEYFRERGLAFETVITGTLQRHLQSYAAIAEGLQSSAEAVPMPGLNEYDSGAVVALAHTGEPLPKPTTPEIVRQHFKLLRDGLRHWMDGGEPAGMPTYPAFRSGVAGVLDHVRENTSGDVLLVSSGGPISCAVGLVLGTPPTTTIDLNLRMRNSALSEFAFTPKRHVLVTFNTLPHLDTEAHRGWITYS
jgi:broad specificity phosphatase PhoE